MDIAHSRMRGVGIEGAVGVCGCVDEKLVARMWVYARMRGATGALLAFCLKVHLFHILDGGCGG